jgi:hypothetical protein
VRELGGVFGVAILAAVFVSRGGYSSPGAFMHGFRAAEIVAAAVAIAGAGVAALAPGKAQVTAVQPPDVALAAVPHPQEI